MSVQGLAPLEFVSLDEDWAVASTPCLYLEDDQADIPHFNQASGHVFEPRETAGGMP